MTSLRTELAHAWRSIGQMRGTALVIILSIGAGVAVNTTVFSFVQDRVLKPLPGVGEATAIHLIEPLGERGMYPGSSWLEYRDIAERLTAFDAVFAFRMQAFTIGAGVDAARESGMLVSGNYFDALKMQPALGRLIGINDVTESAEAVAVVSYEYWQDRLGGSPDAIGKTLRVNSREVAIVGVTPRAFKGTVIGIRIDVWVPATLAPVLFEGSRELVERSSRGYQLAGRLKPGMPVAQAASEFQSAMADLARQYPETNRAITGEVLPFWQAPRGPQRMLARSLFILQGLMLVLLLAVCGNTATLLLARVSQRQREVGVRLAVGAKPWRVVRLLLIENGILGMLGAAAGAAGAAWLTPRLAAIPLTTGFPVRMDATVDMQGLLFAAVLGAGSALLFGLIPALHLARIDPLRALRGSQSSGRPWLRNAVMASQAAAALVVLIAAGLFYRSLQQTRDIDPGFALDGVLLARYDLTAKPVPPSAARRFAEMTLERLAAAPELEVAAIAQQVPLDIHGLPSIRFSLEGIPSDRPDGDAALSNVVTRGYFQVMRMPMLAGRDFVDIADQQAPREAIVNRAFVERFLGNAEPLGRRLQFAGRAYSIVGVVETAVSNAFGEPPAPCVYFSYRDRPSPVGQVHARTRSGFHPSPQTPRRGDPGEAATAVRQAVGAVDPTLAVYDVRSLRQHVDANLGLRKIPAQLFMFLGPMLLGMAAVGVYAMVASTVSRRSNEIGVRLALGATVSGIIRTIMWDTLVVVSAGAAAGWLIAVAAYVRLVSTPIDPVMFAGAPLLLLLVAAIASWVPARRTAAIDPVIAFKAS